MLSLSTRICLFLSSYFPLFVIFTIQNYSLTEFNFMALIPTIIGIVSLIWLAVFIRWTSSCEPRLITVSSIQRKDAEVMSYIASYLIPFMGVDFSKLENWISLLIFFLILMVIYINSNLIHINPMLNLVGYHVYEIETNMNVTHTIISKKRRLARGCQITITMIDDNLFLERQ